MPDSFASLLRVYRNNHQLTQEDLAIAIGRKKMAISMFETGRNLPPSGELLENIISALSLSEEQADCLRYYAAKERNELPNGLEDYYFSTDAISQFIKTAKQLGVREEGWADLLKYLTESFGLK